MSVVPIRPDLPIGITSEAILFCADAIADFIAVHGTDPRAALILLYRDDAPPIAHLTESLTRGDVALASLTLGDCALRVEAEE